MNSRRIQKMAVPVAMGLALLAACGPLRKIEAVRRHAPAASLALSRNELREERKVIASVKRDTLTVKDENGKELLIMKAVKDAGSGEMVATDVLDAAVITARFRNVAERNGLIDLRFEVMVPSLMQDRKWQLRLYPVLHMLGDSLQLESLLITGEDYRRRQMRGYQLYERFLSSIVDDPGHFVDRRNLELFLERNIPDLYRFKTDSSYTDEADFLSYYGVSEAEALAHYTNHFAWQQNEKKRNSREQMYRRYVKAPLVTENIRLDTVIRNYDGDFVYQYTQRVRTRAHLRKIDIVLSGEIYQEGQRLYTMVPSRPLSFYVSSLSAFTDEREKYLSTVIERRASANAVCYVDFEQGQAQLNPDMGQNGTELGRIRRHLFDLLSMQKYDMDSILIRSSASPEGTQAVNQALSARRAAAVADYFDRCVRQYRDSLRRDGSFQLSLDADGREHRRKPEIPDVHFRSYSLGENWEMLSLLVDQDTVLDKTQARTYLQCLEIRDLDEREKKLSEQPFYPYLRKVLYPRLRTVRFDFFLHRKGMVKDTVHTTRLDTTYRKGVEALKNREYQRALSYLRDYKDFNTAIAYVSLDYNASAMAILQGLERSAPVNYMLAILYARNEDPERAVQCYLDACRQDPSFVFRGNLDPEIYVLIQRYGLHREEEENDLLP